MVVMTRCRRDQANWLVSSLKMVKWWSAHWRWEGATATTSPVTRWEAAVLRAVISSRLPRGALNQSLVSSGSSSTERGSMPSVCSAQLIMASELTGIR